MTRPYVLSYDVELPDGEVVRFVRPMSRQAVEYFATKLSLLPEGSGVSNVEVVSGRDGSEAKTEFPALAQGPLPCTSAQLSIALQVLKSLPPRP